MKEIHISPTKNTKSLELAPTLQELIGTYKHINTKKELREDRKSE